MHHLGYYLGIPKQSEILFLTLIGICCTIFDPSLLDLNTNLHKVWQVALDPERFSGNSQIYMKYLLSGVVIVRTFSVHLYLAFYIVMLWPAIFEERPALLLPWLTVGFVKCLGMGIMSLFTGIFTCYMYGIYRPACLDFALAQIVDHAPSFYMWFCVLSYYRDLKTCTEIVLRENNAEFESELMLRRRRTRCLADDLTTHHCPIDEDRRLISVSTIENLLHQFTTDQNRTNTRSLDTLLDAMASEAEKEEIMNSNDDSSLDSSSLDIQEKTVHLLNISQKEVLTAQKNKRNCDDSIFTRSMLEINNLDELAPYIPKSLETNTTPTNPRHLRPTQSEQANLTDLNPVTDFMRNVSEIQIGNALNYSTSSVLDEKESEPKSELAKSEKQRKGCAALCKRLRGRCSEEKSLVFNNQSAYLEEEIAQKHLSSFTPRPTSCPHPKRKARHENAVDFACQASTLSKKVLQTFAVTNINKISTEKVSAKTNVIKSFSKPPARAPKNNLMKGIKQIIIPEDSSGKPSFKLDGYTVAYMSKTQNKNLIA